jgi:hypothetical protein
MAPVEAMERQTPARDNLLEELIRRQMIRVGGWSHCGGQFGTEPTSLALLALFSPRSGSFWTNANLTPLLAHRLPDGMWPAAADVLEANIWATALAINALMVFGAKPETFAAALRALVQCRPLEASFLVRLKFRFSDRHVRFNSTKHGWPWVRDTVSWVVPTSMALITLERAKRRGLTGGSELDHRCGWEWKCSLIVLAWEEGGTRVMLWCAAPRCRRTSMLRQSRSPHFGRL